MTNFDIFIRPLLGRMDKLQEDGFGAFKKTSHDNGRDSVYHWERICTWRKDVVQLVFFNDRPDSCRLGFQVSLIIDGRDCIFSAISVSHLRHNALDYQFPKLLKGLRASQTVDKILKDLFESMRWFDGYKDKRNCLALIREAKPEDNIAIQMTSKIYPAVEKLLLET